MDINLTLFGEMITFAVLVFVVVRYIWPPLIKVIEERQQKIAAGLAAAELSQRELELTKTNIDAQMREAKNKASLLIDQANQQANDYLDKSKVSALLERSKILAQGKLELEQETNKAKHKLQEESVDLIIAAVTKILQQKIDPETQKKLIEQTLSTI